MDQLISYIAPAAPATRRPATGKESFLRPEIGFTPAWYAEHCNVHFNQEWHINTQYRYQTLQRMHRELQRRLPGMNIGHSMDINGPLDLLTGIHGCNTVAAIFGIPLIYTDHAWPVSQPAYHSTDQLEHLDVPDLSKNRCFHNVLTQVDRIAQWQGTVPGFINWQGILNNAQRLRGQQVFLDLVDKPDLCHHVFACICQTMIEGTRLLHQKQRSTGVDYGFATISNCYVNMISPDQYAEFILPFDKQIAEAFDVIGIHNCAWNADPYVEHYAGIPNLGYIDMGLETNLARARDLFPNARRALMYTPMDLANKTSEQIQEDIAYIVDSFAPCDIVIADIDKDVPDEKVIAFVELCQCYNKEHPP